MSTKTIEISYTLHDTATDFYGLSERIAHESLKEPYDNHVEVLRDAILENDTLSGIYFSRDDLQIVRDASNSWRIYLDTISGTKEFFIEFDFEGRFFEVWLSLRLDIRYCTIGTIPEGLNPIFKDLWKQLSFICNSLDDADEIINNLPAYELSKNEINDLVRDAILYYTGDFVRDEIDEFMESNNGYADYQIKQTHNGEYFTVASGTYEDGVSTWSQLFKTEDVAYEAILESVNEAFAEEWEEQLTLDELKERLNDGDGAGGVIYTVTSVSLY